MRAIKIHHDSQRTPEWHQLREGKITASSIVDILGKETLATTKNAIENLAQLLAIETIYGQVEDTFVNYDMQRGIDNEPLAFDKLKQYLAEQFIDCEQIGFAELNEHIGASPDALCSNNMVGEIKCPNPKNYFKYVLKNEIPAKHYAQMQHQMLCTNSTGCYYVNYCVHYGKEYVSIQIVNRDEDMIRLIEERCEMVIKAKMQYIEKLQTIQQTNII
jgi:putative phage-type endonuclease